MKRFFEDQLDQLRTNIIKMGSLVEEQIDFAIRALEEQNLEIARLVIERDSKVDEYDNLIDGQCERIFAMTQPVAIDLRLLMSALKMNNELERIGDIAKNIAERVEPLLENAKLIRDSRILEMAGAARRMVQTAIDSFVNNDPRLARGVCIDDDRVDALNVEIFRLLVDQMKRDPVMIEPAAHLMILARHIERFADHATNIAEDVIFLVDAKIIKHHAEQENPL